MRPLARVLFAARVPVGLGALTRPCVALCPRVAGRVRCWLDNRTDAAVELDGAWERQLSLPDFAQTTFTDPSIRPGTNHTLTFELMGGVGKFKLLSIKTC